MDWRKVIYSDFKIMMGKPIIIGTRISVELVLEKIAVGKRLNKFLRLTRVSLVKQYAQRLPLPLKPYEQMLTIPFWNRRELCSE